MFIKDIIIEEKIFTDILLLEHEEIDNYEVMSITEKIKNNRNVKSIICCNDSKVIIDGHHRYKALKSLNFPIPVTFIDYLNSNVRINPTYKVFKKDVITSGLNRNLMNIKATKHEVYINNTWEPISIISREFKI